MSYAETVFLDVQVGHVPQVVSALSGLEGAGAWVTEIGRLNRITLFRTAETYAELLEGRPEILASLPHEHLVRVEVTSWRVITPVADPGTYGGVYEWRCYEATPDGMADLEERFLAAAPARTGLSPLTCTLVSLEGAPRFAHLWPYADLNQRAEVRSAAVATGTWPPKVASFLTRMENEILVPLPGSAWR
ncbi:NIPSNAP family protein [Gluconobacter frateurii]|uniref:NIPSNAP domain-containing protein n=1 Tax=Gluconobacter frateurii NRIC 0228 TaxID=1307946 RepID=A0ABQ0QCQ0_9PROT|nr:NIPSNAP family protein [Gluconobacter frateurii]OAG72059.1 hypothetical protein A0J51_02651 [Gluconobacter japonicus]GBR13250.1 hypothetical protein AA0228_1961 [Gluconobacter frateurii NRIC 0228]GLP89845.1 hypothetical protein GCM10007868_09200 [Gluconobacter frateurii]